MKPRVNANFYLQSNRVETVAAYKSGYQAGYKAGSLVNTIAKLEKQLAEAHASIRILKML